jgi:hypothetical protein
MLDWKGKNTDIYVRILICRNCTLEKLQAEGILMLYSGVKNIPCFYNWPEAKILINIFFISAVPEMFGTEKHAYRN